MMSSSSQTHGTGSSRTKNISAASNVGFYVDVE